MISRKTCVRLVALIAFAVSATAFSAKHASFDGGMFDAMLNSAIGFNRKSPNGKTPQMSLRMDPSEMMEVFQAFLDVESVMRKSGERRKAYLEKLKAQGIEEEPMSKAGVAFEIDVLNNRFAFDRYGYLSFDDRFVEPDERPALDRAAALYRRFHSRWMKDNGRTSDEGASKPQPGRTRAAAAARPTTTNRNDVILDRIAEWRIRRVPVFRGFEDDRYQEHDALIVRCVDEFNRGRAAWAGATSAQGRQIPALTTALVKSHMIEETGGRDARSLAAWDSDPMQVNVPGDWSDAKMDVGLSKPARRNEGSAEQNIRAAIKFLVRKGFGASGRRAGARPGGTFDGWQTALKRYNGRHGDLVAGRGYSEVYAEHIVERAKDPGRFVAIRKKVDK